VPAYFPIIYVRGFAFSDSEIEETTDDPTNGFNIGSTHARQGFRGSPIKYRFPGPFVRLMTDHGYEDAIHGYEDSVDGVADPRRTLWILRFYEPYSDTFAEFGKSGRPSIVEAATGLQNLVEHVREVCFREGETDRRVILIAHSMGGLICRSLLQRVLESPAGGLIEKVVTYGTPHGGIPLSSRWIRYHGISNFSKKDLFRALAPKGVKERDFDPRELMNFDAEKFLCVVGTNDLDYEVGGGIVRSLAGIASDGLVPIDNAWVAKAPRAYVYRSHSGRYGLVNSAEAWAAVERFLFGSLRATVQLGPGGDFQFGSSQPGDKGPDSKTVSLLDVECTIGNEALRVNDRKADHLSAVVLKFDKEQGSLAEGERICTFYFKKADFDATRYAFAISFRMRMDIYIDGKLNYSDVSMMQHLGAWISKAEERLVVEYRWLGGNVEQAGVVDGACEITIPAYSFNGPVIEDLILRIQLVEIDQDGFTSESLAGERNSGGSGPAAEIPVEDVVLGEAEPEADPLSSYTKFGDLEQLPYETEDS
jgi:pimeloyl-ACP methyl ester carboxylesterase